MIVHNSHYEKFADGTVRCIDDEIPFEIPSSWVWCNVRDICSMQAGKNISSEIIFSEQSASYPFRCIGGNGLRGFVATYNTEGSHAIVGRQGALCGCLNIECGRFYATEHAVVVDNYGEINYKFMYWFLMAMNLNQYATATAQPGLSVAKILEVKFPLPPIAEQYRIVERLESIFPHIERYSKVQQNLDTLNKEIKTLLQKSILQEAIQGRLVSQNPKDEPASVLLERIRLEKALLIKEKKIKKDKAESLIFRGDDNCYYEQIGDSVEQIDLELPTSWGAVRLGSICQLIDGEKKSGKEICLDARFLRGKSEGTILDKGRFVKTGDNIILVDGENSGEVFAVPQDGYMGSTFKQLWVSREMYLPYVLFFLLFHKETLRNSKKGAAIPHLNRELFNNLIIGVPPIEEQKRIYEQIVMLFEHLK